MISFEKVFASVCCAFLLTGLSAGAQSPWTLRHQHVGGDDLWGIATGPAGLIAVGVNGAILQSADGQTWTRRASNTTDWLTGITWGNGRYVAVGDHGRVLASVDGVAWTPMTQTATSLRLNNVLYANSQFIAVGEAGTILVSPDGNAWSAMVSGTANWLRGLAYPWVVTGGSGTVLWFDSETGAWKPIPRATTSDLEAVALGSSLSGFSGTLVAPRTVSDFFAAGQDGTGLALHTAYTAFYHANDSFSGQPIALPTRARIRCIISTTPASYSYLDNESFFTRTFALPVVAIDEAANVFTSYSADFSSGLWSREILSPARTIRAGTYFPPLESFFAVGDAETIFQRDEVFTGRMANLSTRGFVDQGDKALLAGFVVKGVTPKTVLIRGIGPTLANFGVSTPLTQPVLTILDANGNALATNSAWDATPGIATLMQGAGAFPLNSGSGDTALALTLQPGTYTAEVSGTAGSAGVALVELYDLDASVNGTSRAINLSTRGFVAGGQNVMIAGLVVTGPADRKFVVRGIGPGLARFGVANPLADPVLTITGPSPGSQPYDATSAAQAAGAFAVAPNAGDAAIANSFRPGAYTIRLSSRGGSSGTALLEVYEIP